MSTSEVELLSAEECLEVVRRDLDLRNSENIVLKNYRILKSSNDLVGFMGEYYKLQISVEQKSPCEKDINLEYFIKCVPQRNEFYKDECERKGFISKEARIYAEILPHIQRFASIPLFPKCLYTRHDLIVLEDLSLPSKQLRQLAPHEPYTLKHFQTVLSHQAALHAASIAWELRENVNIGQSFADTLFELQLTTNNEWYVTGIKGAVFLARRHPKFQYPAAQRFINTKLYSILAQVEDLTRPSTRLRNVLCHRDSWDRNIFFEFDSTGTPIACRFIDFQLTRYSPPAIDVLCCLYVNATTPQQRASILGECLDFYYEAFVKALRCCDLSEEVMTRADFQDDCQRTLLAVLTIRAICQPMMVLPAGWSERMRTEEAEKFDFYMNRDRREMFLRVAALDKDYMTRILEPVQELVEYLMDNEKD